MSGAHERLIAFGLRLKVANASEKTMLGALVNFAVALGFFVAVATFIPAYSLLTLCRDAARGLDAACGPGTARSEAIGMIITLGLFALFALLLAAITGDA